MRHKFRDLVYHVAYGTDDRMAEITVEATRGASPKVCLLTLRGTTPHETVAILVRRALEAPASTLVSEIVLRPMAVGT